ncbi:MAG: hypothetical protein EAZ67_04460 [Cytophagales bacterium]|nr:MAG: hypothetical protein EAZ67_04460 [Cytophagales bacterium]
MRFSYIFFRFEVFKKFFEKSIGINCRYSLLRSWILRLALHLLQFNYFWLQLVCFKATLVVFLFNEIAFRIVWNDILD